MQENTNWLINRENSIGNSKEIYVKGKKVSKVMEEDIKILEEMVEKSKDLREEDFYKLIGIKQIQTIATFIKAYKKLKEENSMLRKVNKIVDSVTPEDIERALFEAGEDLKNNYIPKSLVEEKIEELENAIKTTNKENWKYNYEIQISILQELLKGE